MYGIDNRPIRRVTGFDEYCRRKEAAAAAADIPGFQTRFSELVDGFVPIGNAWSRRLFDGWFYRTAMPDAAEFPSTNLVFVQSREGNTGADDPSALGGGETDKHLIYEGLSRVDADAVLAGAVTAREPELVFSVWHPELVALRKARGRSRHPAQVIITRRGMLPFDDGLMFATPELRVIVVCGTDVVPAILRAVSKKPWIEVIDAGDPFSLSNAMKTLRRRGIATISCVGGRTTATGLLREGLVSDLFLTTSPTSGGEPHTPFYEGPPLRLKRIVEKAGQGAENGVRFEHFVVGPTQGGVPSLDAR
jgi:riboflavin biosynthesis pyrimidine reductase